MAAAWDLMTRSPDHLEKKTAVGMLSLEGVVLGKM